MNRIILPEGYKPSEDEDYMNEYQIEYFKRKLESWRVELSKESEDTLYHLQHENWKEADLNDRATVETETGFELRTRDRYRKLIDKIDKVMHMMDNGTYGYCEETGEEIGIKRLEARPIATLSLEAQEKHELSEKTYLD